MTNRAQSVMLLAREQAELLGSETIEPEHVFIALAKEGEGVAARVLQKLGLHWELLRDAIQILAPQSGGAIQSSRRRSASTSRILMAAQKDEAGISAHQCVDTEHLLLAVVGFDEGIVPAVLGKCGVGPEKIREEVHLILSDAA